jgi:hypothetical protein
MRTCPRAIASTSSATGSRPIASTNSRTYSADQGTSSRSAMARASVVFPVHSEPISTTRRGSLSSS